MSCKRILITPGEPAGIGPELTVRIAQDAHAFELVAVCDPSVLEGIANALTLPLAIREIDVSSNIAANPPQSISCIPHLAPNSVESGLLDIGNAAYVVETLQTANDWCLQGKAHAIVTGPVQKSIINDAGIPFSGHTEFFAEQSHTSKVVMMLATEGLRVALATTHIPLKDVAHAVTKTELSQILSILHSELRTKFSIAQPHILVCGLNPHAGEGGHLGTEEIDTIIPVLDELRSQGMHLSGPMPADTLFTPHGLQNADAVLAMYHDQGLPVLKYKGFGQAVNITLGLPYIRTSVDHGTALDLAGKGTAKIGSMRVALKQAQNLVHSTFGY